MSRVVITGQGTINALGPDVATTLEAMREGRCGIGPLEMRDVERLSIRIGAQVRDYDEAARFSRAEIARYDRVTQFALIAAAEAIAQAGLDVDTARAERSGVVIGTAAGGLSTWEDSYRQVFAEGKNRVHPLVVPRLMHNAAASHVSIAHNLRGPCYTVSTACAASNHAIGQAFGLVRSGQCDVMVAGGAEAMLSFGGIKAWEGLRVMAPDACRPFSADRTGMVQGEGAAVFVLESYAHAHARRAEILAEVTGFAMTSDAGDIVLPSQDGAVRAIRGALRDAGLAAAQVGYVNAHGTGTAANDRIECAALTEVFGADAARLMISSTKAMHGHIIGGTGAVELLACIMALREGVIAPTINHRVADPDCALDVVPSTAREARVTSVLSNAFAFGGLNAVLALQAPEAGRA